jgi:hypothetical protein
MHDETYYLIAEKFRPCYLKKVGESCILLMKHELRGFGLVANYADRATAACWRSSANFCG